MLRIDADMYSSTLDVLNALYGKVSKDGYVIIDDYFTIEACRRAVDEFRTARNITTKIHNVDDCRAFWEVEDESLLGICSEDTNKCQMAAGYRRCNEPCAA